LLWSKKNVVFTEFFKGKRLGHFLFGNRGKETVR
jgi:hypothetical protein